jgi:hypothetical protein
MTESMYHRPTVGGNERDVFSRVSRKRGRRTNSRVKRAALQRERRAFRQQLRHEMA